MKSGQRTSLKSIENEVNDLKQYSQKSVAEINEKLDKILNVKVNGTVGLEPALQELYAVTKGLRATKKMNVALREWYQSRKMKVIVPVMTFLLGWLLWGDLWKGLLSLLKSLFGLF